MPRKPTPPLSALGIELRLRRGSINQAEDAKEIGIPQTTLSRIERGATSLSLATAVKLAAWLDVSVEEVARLAATPAKNTAAASQ